LLQFGLFYVNLVILWQFGIWWHLGYFWKFGYIFFTNWYILWYIFCGTFGILSPVLVCCAIKILCNSAWGKFFPTSTLRTRGLSSQCSMGDNRNDMTWLQESYWMFVKYREQFSWV
jgi:hypothetical protein